MTTPEIAALAWEDADMSEFFRIIAGYVHDAGKSYTGENIGDSEMRILHRDVFESLDELSYLVKGVY